MNLTYQSRTSIHNKIAFKFNLPEGNSKWSYRIIKRDLDDYLERVKNNIGVDDIVTKCSKIQEHQLKSKLKNRMLLIQHEYNSSKHVHDFEILQKNKEIQNSKNKIRDLEARMLLLEQDSNASLEEKALLELEISDLKFKNQMYQNECFSKDSIIDHLKDTIVKSLAHPHQSINVEGNIDMKRETGDIYASNSNVMLDSPNSIQTINNYEKIDGLLTKIIETAEDSGEISKDDFIKVMKSVQAIKVEIMEQEPKKANIERHLGILGSISSIASLAGQIAPLIPTLF